MKKIICVLVCLFLFSTTAIADSIDWPSLSDDEITAIIEAGQAELLSRKQSELAEEYTHTSTMDYLIHGFTNDTVDGVNVVMVSVEWINTQDEPDCLSQAGFRIECYQGGKEVDNTYLDNAGNIFDNYMPGYGGTCYYAFENADNSDMTFYIYNYQDRDEEKTELVINPNNL